MDKKEMFEKRFLERHNLICFMPVLDTETSRPIGSVIDISTEGMLVMSDHPIPTGKIFHTKVLLQNSVGNRDFLLLDARSKWCNRESQANFYDTGFELINVTSENLEKLHSIIETLSYKH